MSSNLTVSDADVAAALGTMILSASGWRKVFAPGGDNSADRNPSPADRLLAAGMGYAWGEWIVRRSGKKKPTVLVATDTRPTGPVLAEMIMRGLEFSCCLTRYVGEASAPEAMACSARDGAIDGFAYVSASHNPLGHNGVKFGIGGGVIGGGDAAGLISSFRELIEAPAAASRLAGTAGYAPRDAGTGSDMVSREDGPIETDRIAPLPETVTVPDAVTRPADPGLKKHCLDLYRSSLEEIAGGPGDSGSRGETLAALRSALAESPVRIIADLNGSARCVSADREYLEGLGARLETFNDNAGKIAHAILPEGESLEPCRLALEKAHAADPNALVGYVPDNDGDRGNLVIWDEGIGGARRLEAQEVFALSVLAEFACAAWGEAPGEASPDGGAPPRTALVVNGPTSHRVREIAAVYGAEVHEAEVGEANAVNRAAELRAAGYRVRLLGEGSNGGTITYPAEVRDPLNTVTALLKLLRLPGDSRRLTPFEDWCRRIGRPEAYRRDFGPADVVATLPVFSTTPASAARALASVSTGDHGALKTAWEEIFARQWSLYKEGLENHYGFAYWTEVNNEGTASRRGVGPQQRTGAGRGGLKVIFRDSGGGDAGFIWMRGSGTEPVFRVMAEIRGMRPEAEGALVAWQGAMVMAADRVVRGEDSREGEIPSPF